MRAFLAIRVPLDPPSASRVDAPHTEISSECLRRDLLLRLLEEFGAMGRAVRAVAADGVHLTLKFFGDLSPDLIQSVCDVTAPIATATSPFEFQVRGLGAFPSERRPSVIWAGLTGGEACVELVEELERTLGEIGFPLEPRPFQPHVTLARVKARPPARLSELLAEFAEQHFGSFPVNQIELVGSELTPDGPIYSTLAEFPLGSVHEMSTQVRKPT